LNKKIDINLNIHRIEILDNYKNIEIENSLLNVNPLLSSEWNYIKNSNIKPQYFYPNSRTKVWWICTYCKFEWQCEIFKRNISAHIGCNKCHRKITDYNQTIPKKGNSLIDAYPEITLFWDYTKNDILPSEINPNSARKVWQYNSSTESKLLYLGNIIKKIKKLRKRLK